jgi:hypothetical protein
MGASIGRLGGAIIRLDMGPIIFGVQELIIRPDTESPIDKIWGEGGHPLSVDEKLMSVASRLYQRSIIQ